MRFYGREEELQTLSNFLQIVRKKHLSQMVAVTGRRRVGKTTLILKAFEKEKDAVPVFYFFVERRTTEEELVAAWLADVCRAYDVEFPPAVRTVAELMRYLMALSRQKECVCIIDECQDFNLIAPGVWSQLQKVWDLKKNESQMLLVMSGSILSAMEQIFSDRSEPLYGRTSGLIEVKPFTPRIIKDIVRTETQKASPADLLFIYALTGGVAQYLTLLADSDRLTAEGALDYVFSMAGSWLRYEGEIYLANEFKAESVTYHEILRAVTEGATKWSEIENRLKTTAQLSPYLARLERFGILKKLQPIFQEDNKRKTTKYAVADPYFSFWLTFITPPEPRRLAEAGNWEGAKDYCRRHLNEFLGKSLERWFIADYRCDHRWNHVGGWWDKNGVNEIDLVAVNTDEKQLEIAEVKLNPRRYDELKLRMKAEAFLQATSQFRDYALTVRGLSPENLWQEDPDDRGCIIQRARTLSPIGETI